MDGVEWAGGNCSKDNWDLVRESLVCSFAGMVSGDSSEASAHNAHSMWELGIADTRK